MKIALQVRTMAMAFPRLRLWALKYHLVMEFVFSDDILAVKWFGSGIYAALNFLIAFLIKVVFPAPHIPSIIIIFPGLFIYKRGDSSNRYYPRVIIGIVASIILLCICSIDCDPSNITHCGF